MMLMMNAETKLILNIIKEDSELETYFASEAADCYEKNMKKSEANVCVYKLVKGWMDEELEEGTKQVQSVLSFSILQAFPDKVKTMDVAKDIVDNVYAQLSAEERRYER